MAAFRPLVGCKVTFIEKQALSGAVLPPEIIRQTLHLGLEGQYRNQRVLVLIPDHTRSLPLPLLFRMLVETLPDVAQLDFMVALGTHPPLTDDQLNRLVGITAEERSTQYATISLLNHTWDDPAALETTGVITQDEVRQIAGERWHPSLGGDVPVRINKAVLDYGHILILGPTFPHEVVGFSGGVKYLFPGISGPEMINATHWLGALAGVVGTIGIKDTPVRAMIHAAALRLAVPITLIALVVEHDDLAGIFIGDYVQAWSAAADLSAQRHIQWVEAPYQGVLSCAPPMYDELWTAAKAMYKLEPAVAVGGEVIVYAPHLDTVSHVHGEYIYEVGYHILDYFLQDWARFKHIPLGVLAHSTHMRGSGVLENGIEKPNVKVTLASQIPPEDCKRLNLGYRDPASIKIEDWQNREAEGILYVPKAGEMLYRAKNSSREH
jgi:nickel-dependent lactate racemase